ncbi:50S ribosomal protein L3 N(5)-glutamine methyltransferase [Mangrovitalea sediminis]|uniref:50S ribosomal protein L3 N(5)-glutamine methyltransferase n=1 Tax=Mangrovitalea sediminis TaxID=1982043 RepID=UPI000BE5E4B8|nr:50S ribosomal protein L3 N(5)-glutamine methyltransferase [Mangrovitalea sediminis]
MTPSTISHADDLISIRDFLRYAVSRFEAENLFYGHGSDNVWDEAVHLVFASLHLPLDNNAIFLDARLTRSERELLLNQIERRVVDRVPVSYLTGEAWFMGLPFYVNEHVLIPRSPIAELLENSLQPWLGERPVGRLLDLCTGSGCIGIAAALVFPEAEVDLADISPEALAVAERNIHRHEVGDRVQAVESDLFEALSGRYDVILSNPPYVDASDLAAMPEEFRHEPVLGLEAGTDGLDVVRRILAEAQDYLTEDGLLVVEVGNSAPALEEAFPELPFTWLDFERGGHGVFLMMASDLRDHFKNLN